MVKLIVPIVTPDGLDKKVQSDTIPAGFQLSVQRLIDHVRNSADVLMPGGTTGEGHLLTMEQYEVLLKTVQAYKGNLGVRAGVLARDEQVATQIQIAAKYGITDIVLGLNHTGDYEVRVQTALESMGPAGRLFLYNMPGGFWPLPLHFVAQCFRQDKRVVGIKDSCGDERYFDRLISLKGSFPDRIISHGSEPLYGKMPVERRKLVDEVTAGTANATPELLRNFLDNPKGFAQERDRLGAIIGVNHPGLDTSTIGGVIRNYIYGLKDYLRARDVLVGSEDRPMYGEKVGSFFPRI